MPRQSVDFTEINNPMLKWLLDDGTEVVIKVVLMRVTRLDELLPDGQFKHEFGFQQIVDQIAPAGDIDLKALAGRADK